MENQTEFQNKLDEKIFDEKSIRDIIKELYYDIKDDKQIAKTVVGYILEIINKNEINKIAYAGLLSELMKRLEESNKMLNKLIDSLQRLIQVSIISGDENVVDVNDYTTQVLDNTLDEINIIKQMEQTYIINPYDDIKLGNKN